MQLPAYGIAAVLKDKGVKHLYHANSVRTACSFLKAGKLMSRGTIESLGLDQTEQGTDEIDKRYSIWFDIFVDGVDVHRRVKGRNFYGPVTFIFSIDMLLDDSVTTAWVTGENPSNWDEGSSDGNWVNSIDELRNSYSRWGDLQRHIVFRSNGGSIPLAPYLENVLVDEPYIQNGFLDVYSVAVGALWSAAREGGISQKLFKRRDCDPDECQCQEQYHKMTMPTLNKFYCP